MRVVKLVCIFLPRTEKRPYHPLLSSRARWRQQRPQSQVCKAQAKAKPYGKLITKKSPTLKKYPLFSLRWRKQYQNSLNPKLFLSLGTVKRKFWRGEASLLYPRQRPIKKIRSKKAKLVTPPNAVWRFRAIHPSVSLVLCCVVNSFVTPSVGCVCVLHQTRKQIAMQVWIVGANVIHKECVCECVYLSFFPRLSIIRDAFSSVVKS